MSRDDGEQFATIFDRYAAVIHRYLSRRIGVSIADDLTSQTFLVAFDRRTSFDPAHPTALPWLYGIATKLLSRHRRTEVRQYRAFARTGVDAFQDSHDERIAARVTASALSRQLAAALHRLPADQRDVLLLIAWEELSYQEAGDALGIPVGTVRSRLSRARSKVRDALGGSNPADITETVLNLAQEGRHG